MRIQTQDTELPSFIADYLIYLLLLLLLHLNETRRSMDKCCCLLQLCSPTEISSIESIQLKEELAHFILI